MRPRPRPSEQEGATGARPAVRRPLPTADRRGARRNRPGAFTLIELIVVLMVIAITAAMVVPYASSGDSQVVSAARVAASDLQYAQSLAITTQAPVTVTYSTANRSYTVSNASGTLNHPMTGKPYVVGYGTMRGYESVLISSAVFGSGSTVVFDATGAPDNVGSVTLRAGTSVYRLDVAAATGNVTVTRVGG